MQHISVSWLVLSLGGSPVELGIVAALEYGPALFLSPLGGVYADRVDRRRGLILTQALALGQVTCLLALTLSGGISIPAIMVLSCVLGVINAVDTPLRLAFAADLVPRALLSNAIALNAIAFNGARIIGPALAGLTLAASSAALGAVTAGVAVNLAINVVSFAWVLAALLLMGPPMRRHTGTSEHETVLRSLREAFSFVRQTPLVRWTLILVAIVATFGINFRVLLPLFTQDVLQADAETYGALFASLGAGALCGAAALALVRERRTVQLMLGGTAAFGGALFGLALVAQPVAAALLLFCAGFSQMMLTNTANAAIQGQVGDALRGRVMSLHATVMHGSIPIGGLVAGVLVELGGVPLAFMVGSVASIAAGLLVWGRLRQT